MKPTDSEALPRTIPPVWRAARARWIRSAAGIRFAAVLGPAWVGAGILVLALRMLTGVSPSHVLWAPLLPFLLFSWALRRALRDAPGIPALRALADAGQSLGGRLMAEDLPGGESWTLAGAASPPRLRWDARRAGLLLGVGAIFLAGAFLLPVQGAVAKLSDRMDLRPVIEPMREQLTVLEETRSAEPEEVDRMRRRLEQAAEEARGRDPARAYESLDHLRESMARTAERAATEDTAAMERMAAARDLSAALAETQHDLPPQTLAAALEALQKQIEAAQNQLPPGITLPPELAEALAQAGPLDPALLKQIAESLGQGMALTLEDLQRLAEARLIDPSQLKAGEAAMGGQGQEELMALLMGQGGEGMDPADLALLLLPGQGGISRGPGAAHLQFAGETEEAGQRFTPEALPPGHVAADATSRRVGVAALDPTRPLATLDAAGTGALADASGAGGQAAGWNVPPRHRAAVQRYFDRE